MLIRFLVCLYRACGGETADGKHALTSTTSVDVWTDGDGGVPVHWKCGENIIRRETLLQKANLHLNDTISLTISFC